MFYKLKNFFQRFRHGQIFYTLIGLAILVLLGIPLVQNMAKNYRTNQEIDRLRANIDNLQAKNFQFEEMIKKLSSDQFVEEQARLNLNLKKPGEQVVIVKDNNAATTSDAAKPFDSLFDMPKPADAPVDSQTNFDRWLKYFFM